MKYKYYFVYSSMRKSKKEDLISEYKKEYEKWYGVLNEYHTGRFTTNYKQYTAYSSAKGTRSKMSDPLASEQVERVIQRIFEREPKFYSLARGQNIPKELSEIISSVVLYYWNCPERVMDSGTMRSKLKMIGREFCITGNAVTETYYNSDSQTPDARPIPIEDVIFDPTKRLKESDRYYISQYVSMKYLEDNIIEKDEETGIETGLFDSKAVKRLKISLSDDSKIQSDPSGNRINRSGSESYDHSVNEILLVSVWDGSKVCRIANWEEVVQESKDPMQIGEHPYTFAQDIELPKEPYAIGMLDFLNGITHSKDLLLSQIVDYGAKSLNPPMFVDPSLAPVNRASLVNAYKLGGIVYAKKDQVDHKQMPPLPAEGFNLLNYLQQRAESSSGIGSYLGGVPNQSSDKTQGTKGGIELLLNQAVSPVKDRQLNLEESIIEPMVNKWLKMAGNLMGENEIKYVFITGQNQKWVRITKGILTGKITLIDLAEAELVDEEQFMELSQEMISQGKNPETELVFDIDWIVRVETGTMAEVDSQKEIENFDTWVQFATQIGGRLDNKKIILERAMRSKIKDPEQYLIEEPQLPNQGAGMAVGAGQSAQPTAQPPIPSQIQL